MKTNIEERVGGTEQEVRQEKTDPQSGISHPKPGPFLGGQMWGWWTLKGQELPLGIQELQERRQGFKTQRR